MRSGYFVLVCSLAILAFAKRKDMNKEVSKNIDKEMGANTNVEKEEAGTTGNVPCACDNKHGHLLPVGRAFASTLNSSEEEKVDGEEMCTNSAVYHSPVWFTRKADIAAVAAGDFGKIACQCDVQEGYTDQTRSPFLKGTDNFDEMKKKVQAKAQKQMHDAMEAAAQEVAKEYGVTVELPADIFKASHIKSFDYRTPAPDMQTGKKWACCCRSGKKAGNCQSNVPVCTGWPCILGFHHEAPESACE